MSVAAIDMAGAFIDDERRFCRRSSLLSTMSVASIDDVRSFHRP